MSDDEYSSNCLFSPSMTVQRYIFTRNAIQQYNNTSDKAVTSVLDVGSHECNFVRFLKQLKPSLTEIHCLDVKASHLQMAQKVVSPSAMDHFSQRKKDLNVHLYTGSILQPDARFGFSAVDALTAIEVVEHLHLAELPSFVSTVFGHICPKLAIITTPNYEYNRLIQREVAKNGNGDGQAAELPPPPFRDEDHKFEWTRKEFASWCKGIVEQYTDYCFVIDGVGRLKTDLAKNTGFCTQTAVFTRTQDETSRPAKNSSSQPVGQVYQLYSSHCYKKNVHFS